MSQSNKIFQGNGVRIKFPQAECNQRERQTIHAIPYMSWQLWHLEEGESGPWQHVLMYGGVAGTVLCQIEIGTFSR